MGAGSQRAPERQVSPLELFFDLIFVFAVSQLSHHLLDHLTARGAFETLILSCAVFTVCVHTSFEATFFDITRRPTQVSLLVAMGLGLFINAAISSAFAEGGLAFAIPLVLIQVGRGILTSTTAPSPALREHYRRMLVWLLASVPFWLAGAIVEPGPRLWWWTAAVVIDVGGTMLARPWPGRRFQSSEVPFDGSHMSERARLFLILALGETVLTTGSAIAGFPAAPSTILAGAAAFVAVASLWALFFGGAARLVEEQMSHSCDPVWAARMGANGQYVVLAGLVAVAVGSELVIAHPFGHGSLPVGLLLFGGAMAYVGAQAWYLQVTLAAGTRTRWVGCGLLLLGLPLALVAPPVVSLLVLDVVLVGLALLLVRPDRQADRARAAGGLPTE